jgi:superfamily II DNA or RNA helicase
LCGDAVNICQLFFDFNTVIPKLQILFFRLMQTGTDRKGERLFALVLTQHRRWGTVLMPYILKQQPGWSYHTMAEALSPYPDRATLAELDNEERETVRLVNEYSDRNLYKLYSKHRDVREFIEKVSDHDFERLIKPYIESRIHQCLHIALNEQIPVYLQKIKITTLHPDDRLTIAHEAATPVFRFDRDTEGSSYSLIIESSGNRLDLRKSVTEILSSRPCVIRTNQTILFISDIEGAKLKPFLTRSSINIPRATEEKYFSTFVLSVISRCKVTGTGFTIEQAEPVRQASLTIERGIAGVPVAILKFRYDEHSIFFPDEITHFTSFSNEGGKFVFRIKERDSEWEKSCVEALDDAGLFTDDGINYMTAGAREENGNAMYDLIETVATNNRGLTAAGLVIRTGSLARPYSVLPVEISLSHRLVNDWFDLKAVVNIGLFSIPFTRLRSYILRGIREYPLPDGTVAVLPEEWFTHYRSLLEMGQDNDESLLLHKQHFSIISDLVSDDNCDICLRLGKLTVPRQLPLLPPPAGLKAEMRPYQIEGLTWLHFLQTNNLGGCLADDMGLGKTLQTLALLMWNQENHERHRERDSSEQTRITDNEIAATTSLIIVPASLSHNWLNEIRRFCPSLKTLIHHGTGRHRSTAHFTKYNIIISTYHTVRQDIGFFDSMQFFYVVLDESQHIKNPSSNIYRAVMRLKACHRLVLTGTPVENSLTDLWTQLSFVNPGLLGSLTFFKREFARPIEKNNEEEKEKRLHKIIHPFIMRRTKEMVAGELPPVTEQVIHCDMYDDQAAIYEREKSVVRNRILENIESVGIEKSAIMVLQGLMRLRQIANHPLLTDERYGGGSGKFDTVTYDIESVISEGHKILIFSSFVKHLELFPGWLNRHGIGYAMLTGSTTDREKVINSFRNDDRVNVFLISLKAGGLGLNLTEADYVFILDPWWNPASEIQALSRAHRIGQEKRVFVYRYISGGTIEEKIQYLQERKSRLAGTFTGTNNPLAELEVSEMLEILN